MLKKSPLLLPGLGAALVRPVPRGLIGVPRADASDPKVLIAEIQKTVQAMRESHEEALKGKADVVALEKVERINADVDKLMKLSDEFSVKLAALSQLTPKDEDDRVIGDIKKSTPAQLAAMKTWMRWGENSDHLTTEVRASLTKSVDADGGYTAPIEWDRTLMQKLKQVSMIRQNARVQAITTAGFKKLYGDRAVGSGWVGETATRPATTTPQFAQLDFSPGEIYAFPFISQQLLQDSALDLETWLAGEVETEFARQEGIAFLSGDGVNKPFGILTYVTGAANAAKHPWGAIQVANSGNANLLTADGMIDAAYSLESDFTANAKWYLNRSSLGAIRKLKDGQGNYLWQPTYVLGQPQTIIGYPVVEIPGMPVIAAGNIAVLFGDMDATYLVVDRVGINVIRDPLTNKPFIGFYTTKRVGGGVYNPQPMRAVKVSA